MTSNDTLLRPDYFLASEEEMNRLSSQHSVVKNAMGGLLLFPVDHSKGSLRILDSGTADGTWIIDLQKDMPSETKFVGTDIDASKFPQNPPTGTTYHAQDIRATWPEEWRESFDIVHQRLTLVAAGPATKTAVHGLAALVKPGGWIQLIEGDGDLNDKTGPAFRDFVQLMKDVFKVMGTSLTLSRDLAPMLSEEGFVDVQERVVVGHLGASNADPELARQGAYSTTVAARGLIQFGSTLPSTSLSLESGRLGTLLTDLKKELNDRGCDYTYRAVWGRKA